MRLSRADWWGRIIRRKRGACHAMCAVYGQREAAPCPVPAVLDEDGAPRGWCEVHLQQRADEIRAAGGGVVVNFIVDNPAGEG